MARLPRLVGLLWRWHRRLGLAAALFALLLAVTGILLNHTAELGLDRSFIDAHWLHRAYGDRGGTLPAYRLGERWLFRSADGRVYLDALEVAPCRGALVGAAAAGELLVAACAEELLLLTGEGVLVESFAAATGLPTPVTAIGELEGGVLLQVDGAWRVADLDAVEFGERPPAGAVIRQLAPGSLPDALRRAIPSAGDWLTWERLLLDLHSGRLFGRAGVLLVDAAGVLLGCLALSGVAMWWLHRRRRRG